ncbi:unnamed protein product (macronuclear) [Paramecium tetraurelia]|uniref:STOP protein n=1 Tax=Paramecium tetraurelia TaxID=5888 RepID=A0BPC6_PARTE|nr:uncharacterized protein GSPATT00005142001 [Paramecium tetraurelia]CAK60393.1 unnamed protein product [Paramecium tetraurelia]|eukprot:XP_001427791.1 hypothetical protein (macronuclear) [Paramecium tetraurelia strain d4-2]
MAQQTPKQYKANLDQQSTPNQNNKGCPLNQSQGVDSELLSSKKKEVYDRIMSSQTNRDNQTDVSQYFDHLGGKCLCSLCNCGKHKCNSKNCVNKPQLHGNYTIYQKEFVKKTPENGSRCNQNIFQQPKPEGDLGNVTTYKHDFPGYNSKVELQKNTSKPTVSGVPFSGISTYNNMYLNWGMGDTPQLLPQNNPTVIKEMPFMGKSIYKDSYQGAQTVPVQSCKNMNKALKSPLSPPDLKFYAESISKSSYKPFKPETTQSAKGKQDSTLNPSYNGQYNSEYRKEFDPKHQSQCPAKEVLEEVARSTQF